jgi:hypothetical protein
MENVPLSPKVKKLSKDFLLQQGQLAMTLEKMKHWVAELDKVPAAERPKVATDLIALAMKFEREAKEGAGLATAQLYFFAAGLIKANPNKGQATETGAPAPKRSAAKPAGKSGGWSAKSKR